MKDRIKLPWTMDQLKKVLKSLKREKAREIFKPEVAGSDLQLALLKIANKINQEQIFPEMLKYSYITSVYKGKERKENLINQRVFF